MGLRASREVLGASWCSRPPRWRPLLYLLSPFLLQSIPVALERWWVTPWASRQFIAQPPISTHTCLSLSCMSLDCGEPTHRPGRACKVRTLHSCIRKVEIANVLLLLIRGVSQALSTKIYQPRSISRDLSAKIYQPRSISQDRSNKKFNESIKT